MDKNLNCSKQTIKSYVFRQGRLTANQKDALDNAYQNKFDYYQTIASTRNSRKAVLEIGFGDGRALLQQAINNPDIDFFGVEVYPPGVGQLLSQCRINDVSNLFVFHGDVETFLTQEFLPTWSKVQVYFPDPWHKKRHKKRRLISESFIKQLETILSYGSQLHIITDWDDYAEHIELVMAGAKKFLKVENPNLERAQTKYELRALKLGHTIHEFLYVLG